MSLASLFGVLHILIFTFSPKALTASVVTAFCVCIRRTISVQKGVGMCFLFSPGFTSLLASASLLAFTSFIRYLMVLTIR